MWTITLLLHDKPVTRVDLNIGIVACYSLVARTLPNFLLRQAVSGRSDPKTWGLRQVSAAPLADVPLVRGIHSRQPCRLLWWVCPLVIRKSTSLVHSEPLGLYCPGFSGNLIPERWCHLLSGNCKHNNTHCTLVPTDWAAFLNSSAVSKWSLWLHTRITGHINRRSGMWHRQVTSIQLQ